MWPVKWFTIVWIDMDGNVQTSYYCLGMGAADACRHLSKHIKILKVIKEFD